MACQKCKSNRVLSVNAKCSDLCFLDIGNKEKNGYVPRGMGIGGGDSVRFEMCLDCGQVQGTFPIPQTEMEE